MLHKLFEEINKFRQWAALYAATPEDSRGRGQYLIHNLRLIKQQLSA